MAREFIDGFETGDFGLWDTSALDANSTVVANSLNFPGGSYCFHTYTGWLSRTVTSRSAYYVAMRLMLKSNDINQSFIQFRNGTTVLGCARIDNDNNYHHVKIYRGDEANLIATGATATPFGTSPYTPFHIEFYYAPSTTSGSFIVKINGTTDANLNITGAQTSNNDLNIDNIRIGSWGSDCTYIDDVVIETAGWIGRTQIEGLVPNGAGATTQWTPSAGSNYQCVDETPKSDSDSVSTNTNDNIDTYAMSDLVGTGTVKAVALCVRAKYDGTPNGTNIAGVVRTGGSNYAGSDKALATSYSSNQWLWETNPSTSSTWAASAVNGLEAGIKMRA